MSKEPILRFTGKDLQDISFDEWLETKPTELGHIAYRWFDIMKTIGPEVQDIFHDNYPIVCYESAPFAYVNAYAKHVNVGFFYGAELLDDKRLLEGTGKRMRHIKIRPDQEINEEAIKRLIQDAYFDIIDRVTAK